MDHFDNKILNYMVKEVIILNNNILYLKFRNDPLELWIALITMIILSTISYNRFTLVQK